MDEITALLERQRTLLCRQVEINARLERERDAAAERGRQVAAVVDLQIETSVYLGAQRAMPTSLAARWLRHYRDTGEPIAHQRAFLQDQRDDGNAYATEVLELLADDPWWEQT